MTQLQFEPDEPRSQTWMHDRRAIAAVGQAIREFACIRVSLMAATCSHEQAGLIVGMVPRRGKIWIMPDGDQAGRYCAESLLKQIAPFRMVRWPELKDGRKPQHCTVDELREKLA